MFISTSVSQRAFMKEVIMEGYTDLLELKVGFVERIEPLWCNSVPLD